MVFSVTLTFRGGKSLTKKTDLILTFDKQTMAGMYDRYHPIAWKVTSFPKGGGGSFKATYTADLAFLKAQVSGDVLESAGYSTHINPEQQTILTIDDPSPPATYKFSKPEPWTSAGPGQFMCENKTGAYQDIGVGFFQNGHQDPSTAIVLRQVPGNTDAIAEFTPVLSAYVATGYKETQIIKAQIQSSLSWEKDVTKPMALNWRLEESGAGFILVEDTAN
ncbi:hypothetical protein NP233_g1473 [Leucocoprinus birnbaumii]|uniref:Uncharacterized protein n=1 Tax=Leucocoprinus birnbaumii TaxID=56174 RepID=A0AAD5YVS4_9AGAR|nr:hypothetical protein NP233_g1473 [Leucocoprinus birnbaumii]